jgi:metal-responsive CopG/Arc/MetJ family transcriptional regulator
LTDKKISTVQRIPEKLLADIDAIAEEEAKSRNEIVIDALKLYRDAAYMQDKASVIPMHILNAVTAETTKLEQRINDKTNQVLSSVAIQLYVVQRMMMDNLEVTKQQIEDYTVEGVTFVRQNNRVFRMGEDR